MEFRVSQRDFALNPVRNSISLENMIEKGQISNGVKFVSTSLTTAFVVIAGCNRSPRAPKHTNNLLQHRLRAKVQSLDPVNIGDTVSHGVASEIFECLYDYHYLNIPE